LRRLVRTKPLKARMKVPRKTMTSRTSYLLDDFINTCDHDSEITLVPNPRSLLHCLASKPRVGALKSQVCRMRTTSLDQNRFPVEVLTSTVIVALAALWSSFIHKRSLLYSALILPRKDHAFDSGSLSSRDPQPPHIPVAHVLLCSNHYFHQSSPISCCQLPVSLLPASARACGAVFWLVR
jgi:hypothetical protein